MRAFVLSFFAIVVVLVPNVGSAQGAPLRMAPPEVNAATADWQLNGEPIIVSSTLFQATRASRMFDGQVHPLAHPPRTLSCCDHLRVSTHRVPP